MRHTEQDNLEAIIETIDGIISIQLDSQVGEEISERLSVCASLLSTSANSVATAKLIYNERLGEILSSIEMIKLSPTDKKLILTGRLSKESYWVTMAERQNAALVHAIDSYRSMLSYLKEDMKVTNLQNNLRNEGNRGSCPG